MHIAIIAPGRDSTDWVTALQEYENIEVHVWPKISFPERIDLVIAWNAPKGVFKEFTNLKLISSMGAGVDHIIKDRKLPNVPIMRIVDDQLSLEMSNYVLMAVLNFQRQTYQHFKNQQNSFWDNEKSPNSKLHVGVLGMGILGLATALALVSRGFIVSGYSKTEKNITGVQSYTGDIGLREMMQRIDVLVNLLPLTDQTRGILSMPVFQMAKNPFYLINVARGGHLLEEDLLEALDSGIISGACLDVFNEEPLAKNNPLWQHTGITITPHIASITDPSSVVAQILDNFKRVNSGLALINQIDLQKGY